MDTLAFFHHACAYDLPDLTPEKNPPVHYDWQKLSQRAGLSAAQVLIPLGILATAGNVLALQLGDSGNDVTNLQTGLKQLGYFDSQITGYYGSITKSAVQEFQADAGLDVDGEVGPATMEALNRRLYGGNGGTVRPISYNPNTPVPVAYTPNTFSLYSLGDQGEEVRQVQQRLRELGYYNGPIDGYFGASTDAAVRRFQADYGIVPDGIVGRDTRFALQQGVGGNRPVVFDPPNNGGSGGRPGDGGNVGRPPGSAFRYVVVIPTRSGATVPQVRRVAPGAFLRADRRGSFVQAGAHTSRPSAEQQSRRLRAAGFDSRVVFF